MISMRENAFLVTKRFSTVIMLIFVTSTLESIDEYRFPGNSRKKKFSQTLEGTTGPKKHFVHYAEINLRNVFRDLVLLQFDGKKKVNFILDKKIL